MDEKKKRKVTFNPDLDLNQTSKKQKKTSDETGDTRLHSGKYTLDSDEDDAEELDETKQMNKDELDDIGQEKATIGFDDDVKITPFNIDEEMEEGHYDESGTFHWKKKDKAEVRDAWLDDIDWNNVKNYKLKNPQATDEDISDPSRSNLPDDIDESDPGEFNEIHTLKSMLTIMQPGESVVRAIKRLGLATAKNPKSKQREKQRKLLPGEVPPAAAIEQTPEELKKSKLMLEEMSGLADQFVSNGELDIYQETYERLKSKLDRLQSSASSTTASSAFDMYGDTDVASSINSSKPSTVPTAASVILWEHTTDESAADKLQGPFTTEQMIRLTDMEGKLDRDTVRCRRIGTQQFYSIKRIDFDLYLD